MGLALPGPGQRSVSRARVDAAAASLASRERAPRKLSVLQKQYLLCHGTSGFSPKKVGDYRDIFHSFGLFPTEKNDDPTAAEMMTPVMNKFARWMLETPRLAASPGDRIRGLLRTAAPSAERRPVRPCSGASNWSAYETDLSPV